MARKRKYKQYTGGTKEVTKKTLYTQSVKGEMYTTDPKTGKKTYYDPETLKPKSQGSSDSKPKSTPKPKASKKAKWRNNQMEVKYDKKTGTYKRQYTKAAMKMNKKLAKKKSDPSILLDRDIPEYNKGGVVQHNKAGRKINPFPAGSESHKKFNEKHKNQDTEAGKAEYERSRAMSEKGKLNRDKEQELRDERGNLYASNKFNNGGKVREVQYNKSGNKINPFPAGSESHKKFNEKNKNQDTTKGKSEYAKQRAMSQKGIPKLDKEQKLRNERGNLYASAEYAAGGNVTHKDINRANMKPFDDPSVKVYTSGSRRKWKMKDGGKNITIKEAKDRLAKEGRRGDTKIAHINKEEHKLLQKVRGNAKVTKNPKTGKDEYAFPLLALIPKIAGVAAKGAGAAKGAAAAGKAGAATSKGVMGAAKGGAMAGKGATATSKAASAGAKSGAKSGGKINWGKMAKKQGMSQAQKAMKGGGQQPQISEGGVGGGYTFEKMNRGTGHYKGVDQKQTYVIKAKKLGVDKIAEDINRAGRVGGMAIGASLSGTGGLFKGGDAIGKKIGDKGKVTSKHKETGNTQGIKENKIDGSTNAAKVTDKVEGAKKSAGPEKNSLVDNPNANIRKGGKAGINKSGTTGANIDKKTGVPQGGVPKNSIIHKQGPPDLELHKQDPGGMMDDGMEMDPEFEAKHGLKPLKKFYQSPEASLNSKAGRKKAKKKVNWKKKTKKK